MASVKQMRKKGNWYLCYKVPTGTVNAKGRPVFTRVQAPSLYTHAEKSAAVSAANDYEEVAIAAGKKQFSDEMARRFLDRLGGVANVSVAQTEMARRHFERWLASRKLQVADKTSRNYEGVVRDFLKHLEGERPAPTLANVTHEVVTDFRDQEVRRGKSVATINKALSIIGLALESAVINAVLPRNPVRGLRLKRVRGQSAQLRKRRAFSFAEFSRLVDAVHPDRKSRRGRLLNPDWETFILLCGYTGGRQQEVAALSWRDVDLAADFISLSRTKSGDIHRVPIHPALRRHLEARASSAKNKLGAVMPHLARQKGRQLSKHFREVVLPRIGIRQPYVMRCPSEGKDGKPAEPVKVGRKPAEYSLHSLRHSLSTWLNAQGVPEMTRMRLIGHHDTDVSRDYTHEDDVQMRAAMLTIPDLLPAVSHPGGRPRKQRKPPTSSGA